MLIPIFAAIFALSGLYLIFFDTKNGSGTLGAIALAFNACILLLPLYTEPSDSTYAEKVAAASCEMWHRLGGPECT